MSVTPSVNFKSHLTDLFAQALRIVAPDVVVNGAGLDIIIERPKQVTHGDYACGLAMQLAKTLRKSPRDIAQALVAALPVSALVEKVEIAGAGFINVFITVVAKQAVVKAVLQTGETYGRGTLGAGRKVQIEFVSANPTGPLHVGHGRGAAYGASLASLLEAAGFAVTREYYVNDAGRQMDILTLSTWLRYVEIAGVPLEFPENAYQGDYVRDMARQIFEAYGNRYLHPVDSVMRDSPPAESDPEARLDNLIANAKRALGPDYDYVHDFVLTEQLGDCRNDLREFGVTFDSWFSEKSLFDSGMVVRAVEQLEASGHVYRKDGAKWFRSTVFDDEKDRVVQRDNGQYTYFAADI